MKINPFNSSQTQSQFLPVIEQLRDDLEHLLIQHPITKNWTETHNSITRGLLETIVEGWRSGRQDNASIKALRSLLEDMNGSTATVFRASLDNIESWLEHPSSNTTL